MLSLHRDYGGKKEPLHSGGREGCGRNTGLPVRSMRAANTDDACNPPLLDLFYSLWNAHINITCLWELLQVLNQLKQEITEYTAWYTVGAQ